MNPISANPILVEYSLIKELGLSPDLFEDQVIEVPSRWDWIRWLFFGKPMKVVLKKGLDSKKVDSYLTILNEIRIQQEEETARVRREVELRSGR